MLGLKSSTQVVTQGYRRFHTKIKKMYTAFTNSDPENNKQTNKQTQKQQQQQRRTQSTYQTGIREVRICNKTEEYFRRRAKILIDCLTRHQVHARLSPSKQCRGL